MTKLTFAIDAATLADLRAVEQRRPSLDEFMALTTRIRPVVRQPDGELWFVDAGPNNVFTEITPSHLAGKLVCVGRSHTLHTIGWQYNRLRPTCREVLSFLPAELREQVVAFEVTVPSTPEEWASQVLAFEEAKRHVGITNWYAQA